MFEQNVQDSWNNGQVKYAGNTLENSAVKFSVVVLTYNSEKHIAHCLLSAAWADEIIVIDSGSSDRTREIAQATGAMVVSKSWSGYVEQRNFGLNLCKNDWVLMLDVDERVSPDLIREINETFIESKVGDTVGYSIPTRHYFWGKWMRGWYPDRHIRLYRKSQGYYPNRLVHEAVQLNGKIACFKADIYHYSFDNITHMITKWNHYSSLSAEEAKDNKAQFSYIKLFLNPFNALVKMYIIKGGFRDGTAGLVFCLSYAFYVFLKYAKRHSEE